MAKALKISLITLISIIVVLAALLFTLVTFVNPNDFKGTIISQVKKHTGRDMTIDGKIGWTVFPSLGLSVHNVTLANAASFPKQNFASIKDVEFRVNFIPLLSKKIDVEKIYLNGLNVNLMVNAQGKNNWDDLSKAQAGNAPATTPTPAKSDSSNTVKQLANIRIADVTVANASIHLNDQQNASNTTIKGFALNSESIALGKAFPVKFSLMFDQTSLQSKQKTMSGAIDYHGTVTLNKPASANKPLLSLIKLDGDLATGKLLLDKLHVDSVKAKMQLSNSIFSIKPVTAVLYKGTAQSDITVNMQQAQKRYRIVTTVKNIQAGPLFKDVTGEARITGNADLSSTLTMQGNTQQAMTSSLNGSGKFSFIKGELNGLDIGYLLNWAEATYKQQSTQQTNTKKTQFGNLTGSVQINNGVISNNDLLLQAPDYKIDGQGKINLNNKAINYSLQTTLLDVGKNNDAGKLQKALGGTIPLVIKGTFTDMKAQPDLQRIAQARAKTLIKQQVEKYIGKDSNVGKAASEVLDKFLH